MTAESHLLPSVGLPNSWLHLFLKDNKSATLFSLSYDAGPGHSPPPLSLNCRQAETVK
jgi:hypothetical protein